MHYVKKNNLFLIWLPGILLNSSDNCRPYNFQAFANISGNFTTLVLCALQVGVLQDEYSCLGIFCAIAFFPLGILCCLAMKQRVCPNCGAIFG